jgi:hypothetical protein
MLTLDLFEFLRRFLERPPAVEQEDALVVELLRRLVGSNFVGAAKQTGNAAAGQPAPPTSRHSAEAARAAHAMPD